MTDPDQPATNVIWLPEWRATHPGWTPRRGEPVAAASPQVELPPQPILPQEQWVEIATHLFELLDQVDTASDIARQDLDYYRELVQEAHQRRFEVSWTDGQRVVFFPAPARPRS